MFHICLCICASVCIYVVCVLSYMLYAWLLCVVFVCVCCYIYFVRLCICRCMIVCIIYSGACVCMARHALHSVVCVCVCCKCSRDGCVVYTYCSIVLCVLIYRVAYERFTNLCTVRINCAHHVYVYIGAYMGVYVACVCMDSVIFVCSYMFVYVLSVHWNV